MQLPQGWHRPQKPASARGAPPLEKRDPARLLYAAWLKECGGATYMEVARALRFPLDDLQGDKAAAKKKVTRYIKRGRRLASTLGIWPWASWREGKPPPRGKWWTERACASWLETWLAEALGQEALARTEAVHRSLIEPQLLIREALERRLLEPAALAVRFRESLLKHASASVHCPD